VPIEDVPRQDAPMQYERAITHFISRYDRIIDLDRPGHTDVEIAKI